MLLVQGRISQKYGFQMSLLAVLGSQGIVVKCAAAIFFRTVDYRGVFCLILFRGRGGLHYFHYNIIVSSYLINYIHVMIV